MGPEILRAELSQILDQVQNQKIMYYWMPTQTAERKEITIDFDKQWMLIGFEGDKQVHLYDSDNYYKLQQDVIVHNNNSYSN